jgi:hypothetical protein
MSDDSTQARAIARLAHFKPPTDDEVQRGIDAAMADVVRSSGYNPNAFRHPGDGSVIPAGASKVVGPIGPGVSADGRPNNYGWTPEAPYTPVGGATGLAAIERMTPIFTDPAVAINKLSLAEVEACLAELGKRERSKEADQIRKMLLERRD